MSEFLLEIYSEEIPAKMQKRAAADFKRIFLEFFQSEGIKIDENNLVSLISSRRISLIANDIDQFQLVKAALKVGPKTDAPAKAIEGFAASVGLKDIKDLKIIKNEKGEYYAFEKKESKVAVTPILEKNLPVILQKMSSLWPKNMRWQSAKNSARWIRPIRGILAIFDGEIVNFEFAGIASGNETFGHLLLANEKIAVRNCEDYKKVLEAAFVNASQDERRSLILKEINKICQTRNLVTTDKLDENSPLLDEVVGLAEFPQVGIGEIEKEFMNLPREVLILTAKINQKYFCTEDEKGALAPYFIFVSNVRINDKIILDNQKVLKARLSDAKFFINDDLKVPFGSRTQALKNIIFHEKLGTVYDKVKRLEVLNKFITLWIPNANLAMVEKLADLAKNDLTTKCVAEFPELQGIVGAYLAESQGEEGEISAAIAEQYLPIGPNSPIPATPLGSLLSLSDKIDTICGLFLVNQKPTSSKDPLALRRAALGVVRIIIQNEIFVPLRIFVEKAIDNFPNHILKKSYPDKSNKELKAVKAVAAYEVVEFIVERMRAILKDNFAIRSDVTNVLIDDYMQRIKDDKKFDINRLVRKATFINNFVNDENNSGIISLYKRAANIVTIEEKKDNKKYDNKPHILYMHDRHERVLNKKIKSVESKVKKLLKIGDYEHIFALFQELEKPLNSFFDNVKVNVDQHHFRENRLLILGQIKNLFDTVFDFSKVEK